jgi:tetratricopeptide (TPR) repeat protein
MINSIYLEAELAKWNNLIRMRPYDPKININRGMTYFKLGKIEKSLYDFDKAEQLNPQLTPYLWPRGLAYYYLEKYAEGMRQFELDLSVNSKDVEETIWRYLCIAKLENATEAKNSLLPVRNDPRLIMGDIYKLYAGDYTVDLLLKKGREQGLQGIFYSNLYLSLYYEAQREKQRSIYYINQAVKHKVNDYMWHLACVHQHLRTKL